MDRTKRLRRIFLVGLAALGVAAGAAFQAGAQGRPAAPKETTLPEPLTRESVRELVARLSDDQVRKLLLEQLDRTAAATPVKAKADMGMGMAGMVEHNTGMMRSRLDDFKGAIADLPSTSRAVGAKLTEPDGPSRLLLLAGLLAAMLMGGWVAEKLYDRALRHYRARLRQTAADTFTANAFRIAIGLLLDLAGIAVFSLAGLAAFFALWLDHDVQRIAILNVLIAIVIVRMVMLFARFLLAPAASDRLLPFADGPARILRRFAVSLAVISGIGFVVMFSLRASGASAATVDLVLIAVVGLYLVVALSTVWRARAPVAALIRGDGHRGAVVGWLADLWPVLATAYFAGIAAARINDILSGNAATFGVGLPSVVLLIALPIVDMALCRALAAAATAAPDGSAVRARGFVADYQQVFRRAIHIVVIVVGLLIFARLWDLDVFALAQKSMGGKLSSSLLGSAIVLLIAYIMWEAAKTAIDRRLQTESDGDSVDTPKSRLRTLLPIVRVTVLVTIVVMATMSMLAALGVDILPLLAGAGVVGVAIGFGSQTLVRDIVSGAFFLMDDAFRLGEYIEVGDAKGRVEKINVRSVFLRHHRGALNILPYGEIKRLRNTSRDWQVHVMEFRLTYDTSMLQVKKVIKQIGDELAADPDYAADILQPLKSAGVMAAEDSAIVVRAKFTARPTNNAWVVRRMAYDKIIRAFRDAGIRFAHRQVTVNVPPMRDGEEAMRGAAGAAGAALLEAPASKA